MLEKTIHVSQQLLQYLPWRHIQVQSQQYKHQKNVWNLFNVNN